MDNIFSRIHGVYDSFFNNPYKNLTPEELNNKLLQASKLGNLSEVTALLEYGAYVDTVDNEKRTPLMCACSNEHPDIVARLLENKANTELKDRNGSTALIFAAKSNKSTFILEFLIKNGVDIKATDNNGENPLMFACWEGYTDNAAFLLQHGADINSTNSDDCTPLMFASGKGHTGTAAFLLQNGADIKATHKNGRNAVTLAFYRGHTDTAYLLLNWMTPEEREAFANKNNTNLEIVNKFKESLQENALSVRKEIETPQKIDVIDMYDSNFKILPSELRCIIKTFEIKLKLKEQFKDSWYRFSAFEYIDKLNVPVLFLSNNKRKAEGEPEENNRPTKKICSGEKMETDESFEPTIFSNKN